MNIRIAFCGESGAGKSTLAEYLASRWMFERQSIARPMKAGVYATARALVRAGIATVDVDDKSQMVSAMIDAGDAMRADDPDIFVSSLVRRARLTTPRDDVPGIALDDVRYPNEAEALKAMGFRVIRLEASEQARGLRLSKRDGRVSTALATSPMEEALKYVVHDELWVNETEEDMAANMLRLDGLIEATHQHAAATP